MGEGKVGECTRLPALIAQQSFGVAWRGGAVGDFKIGFVGQGYFPFLSAFTRKNTVQGPLPIMIASYLSWNCELYIYSLEITYACNY